MLFTIWWEFRGLWWLNPKRQWFGWLRARSGSGWGEAGTRAKNRARGSAAPLIYVPLTRRHHHTTSLWRWRWWRHVPIWLTRCADREALNPKLQATGVASSEARGAWPSDQASPPIHVQGTDEERRNVALRRIRTPRVCLVSALKRE